MGNSKNILGLEDAYEIAQSIVGNVRLSASLFVEVVDAIRAAEQERDQYKAELESLRAKIKEAQEQEPVGYGLKPYPNKPWDGDTFLSVLDATFYKDESLVPLYAAPAIPD